MLHNLLNIRRTIKKRRQNKTVRRSSKKLKKNEKNNNRKIVKLLIRLCRSTKGDYSARDIFNSKNAELRSGSRVNIIFYFLSNKQMKFISIELNCWNEKERQTEKENKKSIQNKRFCDDCIQLK